MVSPRWRISIQNLRFLRGKFQNKIITYTHLHSDRKIYVYYCFLKMAFAWIWHCRRRTSLNSLDHVNTSNLLVNFGQLIARNEAESYICVWRFLLVELPFHADHHTIARLIQFDNFTAQNVIALGQSRIARKIDNLFLYRSRQKSLQREYTIHVGTVVEERRRIHKKAFSENVVLIVFRLTFGIPWHLNREICARLADVSTVDEPPLQQCYVVMRLSNKQYRRHSIAANASLHNRRKRIFGIVLANNIRNVMKSNTTNRI